MNARQKPDQFSATPDLSRGRTAAWRLEDTGGEVRIGIGLPGGETAEVTGRRENGQLVLTPAPSVQGLEALARAVEALTASAREDRSLVLASGGGANSALCDLLVRQGIALPAEDGRLRISARQFWQVPDFWLPQDGAGTAYPERHILTEGRRHPRRRPKPSGTVYRRHIPWLGGELSFRTVDPEADLATFSRWMNDPRVDEIWEDAGSFHAHRAMLEEKSGDPHILPLFAEFDGTPFGYFEVYWAKENRIGPHYDAQDYDRGWHVAIGEDAYRGREWITAWLPSLMHFIFLDDPRTARIVGEPRWTHVQQIRNLDRAGFAKVKHFDFPHKRALLVMLLRERFFSDRLFAPEAPTA
ncbi:GNAT family N-acetyltransferase [Roseibium salinum]|uniref:GNAT family N-acetyltransferase n=1 Tax=Roseibium salinum TaxID=1604349 RepID=A0ABT3QWW3_9HYPH|nr:GNAT family N-acetyltransferase [Roseibium sp. DSM 29163]MCX2721425.1 GNAT family N-acetyltransferase [Roseibium sp. DSM 29163]